jgi:hypothetical protein
MKNSGRWERGDGHLASTKTCLSQGSETGSGGPADRQGRVNTLPARALEDGWDAAPGRPPAMAHSLAPVGPPFPQANAFSAVFGGSQKC